MHTIYTLGYAKVKSAALKRFAEAKDAHVIDIRFSPRAHVPEWNQAPLTWLLGLRYRHVAQFGSANYKRQLDPSGRIILESPDEGCAVVLPILEQQPVILICACWDVETCHRKVVAEVLAERAGAPVVHLQPDDLLLNCSTNLSLF